MITVRTKSARPNSAASTQHAANDALANPMDRFIGYKIRRLQLVIIKELNTILRDFGLRVMDFAILNVVDGNPGLHQNGIAQLLGAEPPAVVLSLDRLEKAKHLIRRPSPEDRRIRTLHLTSGGKDLLKKANKAVDQQEDRMKRVVGAAGVPALVEGLDKLMQAYGL